MAGGDPDGGSVWLGQLIEDGHGGELLADFQRHYGLDLVDVWRGRLSPRRVMSLSEHLPEDAAIRGEHRGWTIEAYLSAHLLNAVRVADVNAVRVAGGKMQDPVMFEGPLMRTPKPTLDLSNHPLARPIRPNGGDEDGG